MRAMRYAVAALVVVLALFGARSAVAEGPNAIITNGSCAAQVLPANDDGSSPQVALPFGVDFFGSTYSTLWVNNNGNVTFNGAQSEYTPFGLLDARRPIIAPFFADVDTRGSGSGTVHYGQISAGSTDVNGHPAFCVNWVNVGYYGSHTDKLNSFQLVLIDRSDTGVGNFDIEFNYDKVQWETGDASGGSGGIGGTPVRIGYSSGIVDPATGHTASFELPGSGVSGAFLDSNAVTGLIYNSVNSPFQLGRYIFPVRNGAALGHALSGHVWANAPGTAVGGAFLQACPTPADVACRNATTNSAGFYIFNNLPDSTTGGGTLDHDWNVVVYPPSGSGFGTGTLGPVHVAGSDANNQDITLHGPTPLPAGASISTPSRGTATSGIPTVYWQDPITFRFTGCVGGTGTARLVTTDGYDDTEPLVESPPGTYTATFPAPYPHHGTATLTFSVSCGTSGVFDLYIDPSGTVVDQHGHPVAGATVTLLRSDDPAGPFVAVPDGSAIMSPANRHNPDTTDATGHFGWDVLSGFYKVHASKDGCSDADSAVLPIPPPVTGLVLTLDCVVTVDTTPPEIAPHDDVTAEATSGAGAAVSYDAPAATDDVDGPVAVTCSPASGATFAPGTTTVHCAAQDAAGNSASSSFAVHVLDTTAPTVQAPPDVTAEATSSAGAVVAYGSATASDLVDGPLSATCSPASGTTFALGATPVDCRATDAHGNVGHASFTVTVVDTHAPSIASYANVVVDATSPAGAVVGYTGPTASDLVDGSVPVTCSPASGGTFAIGSTTVECTATDAHGNTAHSSFTVHVNSAREQLQALLAWVLDQKVGPGTSIPDKLRSAIADLATGGTCSDLHALDNEARAQTGKKLTAAQAARIRGDLSRIEDVLGCS